MLSVPNSRSFINGGEAIASGGYGCVFKPQLKCNSYGKNVYDSNGVSKLMLKKYAAEELVEIKKVYQVIKKIKNHDKYFIIQNIYGCNPTKLSVSDLIHFDKKCFSMLKKNINAANVNNKLNTLQLINMPYGGDDVANYWKIMFNKSHTGKEMLDELLETCVSLKNLLKNAVVPMNKLGLIHTDVKASNILKKTSETGVVETRLIDWGFSFVVQNQKKIPDNVSKLILLYNVPLGTVLFYQPDILQILIDKHVNLHGEITYPVAYSIAERYFEYIVDVLKAKFHLPLIYEIYGQLNKYIQFTHNSPKIKQSLPKEQITQVLADIIHTYTTKKGVFNKKDYCFNVLLKNWDVYGFIQSFLELIEIYIKNVDFKSRTISPTINKICDIYIKYCYNTDYATTPINTSALISELEDVCHPSHAEYNKDLEFFDLFSDSRKSKKSRSKRSTLLRTRSKKARTSRARTSRARTSRARTSRARTSRMRSKRTRAIR